MSPVSVPGKSEVRAAVRRRRGARDADQRSADAAALAVRLRDLVHATAARRIAAYSPVGGEPDIAEFTALAVSAGIDVLLPVSNLDRSLSWALASRPGSGSGSGFGSGSDSSVEGLHGIPEPRGERLAPETIRTAELVLVPACAVDERGVRLGWGLGYYDRALSLLPPDIPIYAVVHDDEVYPLLPSEPHDVPITGAVTPGGIHNFPSTTG